MLSLTKIRDSGERKSNGRLVDVGRLYKHSYGGRRSASERGRSRIRPGNGYTCPIHQRSIFRESTPLGSLLQPEQPRIDVNVNVEAKPAGDLGYEVTLNIRADARSNERAAFVLELEYAGLFDLTRIPEAQRHAVCLIEAPRLLFPFARQIAAETTRGGGFPPMYLDPIDFGALYRNHLSQQQSSTQGAGATTPAPDEGAIVQND